MTDRSCCFTREDDCIVFRAGRSWGMWALGGLLFTTGLGVIVAAVFGQGELAKMPGPGCLMGIAYLAAGVAIVRYRSETCFDLVRRHWHAKKAVLWLRWGREGSFDELREVELYRQTSPSAEGGSEPQSYYVRVNTIGGLPLPILKDSFDFQQARETATQLSHALSLPLLSALS